ncbi:MAG: 50S ribosomal protein L23 [Acidobacteriota bacterium]|nr:50S ribosomal protein L23 [Blastocatellia bacterium]MDW8412627.1 50S ribosomal protein L23 [Acidobacteriota bacterium]
MRSIWEVIKGPVITEKTLRLKEATQDKKQQLAFYVDAEANKIEVKQAVEKIFGVKVEAVRIANFLGKKKRRGRFVGKQSDYRKAYVTLKAGEKPVEYGEMI